jgi:hypothetical protein
LVGFGELAQPVLQHFPEVWGRAEDGHGGYRRGLRSWRSGSPDWDCGVWARFRRSCVFCKSVAKGAVAPPKGLT